MLLRYIFLAVSYLLGSVPFGYLLVKYVFTSGEDVREVGSGGTGATNVTRTAGRTAGLLTYLLDLAKGMAAVLMMKMVAADDYLWIGAGGIAVIIGHIFPIFLKFRGGKGVATGMGVYLILSPYSALAALCLWVVVVYLTRYISLGSLVGAGALPFLTWLVYGLLLPDQHVTALVIIALAAFALILFAHRENVQRLLRGEEKKFGTGSKQSDHKAATGAPR